jgi:uncharacterized protein YndB with AHSA1/START domain
MQAGMAEVEMRTTASPEQVFGVLSDGWLYTGWVVGASHIRDVDDAWPAVGSKLHHSVGVWPLTISDHTEVLEMEPERTLVLRARAWPVGEARVEVQVRQDPESGGSVVTMYETPTKGPGRRIHTPVQEYLLRRRNIESLERLRSIAERRFNS